MAAASGSEPGAPGSDRRGIARNAISSYGVRGMRIVVTLLMTPYLFRRLGAGGFGTWSVVFTFATIYQLVEFGFTVGVQKFAAEHGARGDDEELGRDIGS